MIKKWSEKLLTPSVDEDPVFVRLLTGILTVTLIGVIALTIGELGLIDGKPNSRAAIVLTLIGILTLVAIRLVFKGYVLSGKIIVPLATLSAVVYLALTHDGLRSTSMAAMPIVVVLAGFLLGENAALIFGFLAVGAATFIGYADINGIVNSPISVFTESEDIYIYDTLLIALAVFLRLLIRHLNNAIRNAKENEKAQLIANAEIRKLQTTLEKRVEERTNQLKATNEVAKVANETLNPESLISRVVQVITEQFGYYYAAIFLIDERGAWAELKDATGEAGRELKNKQHKLQVGGNSMVSAAITTREPRVALDVGFEAVRFENPLLPNTRSEIALPLIIGDRVLGALDVQSTAENDFSEQDIETLLSMTNQVAIALENARLFQETEKNLREIQEIYNRYVVGAWSDMTQNGGIRFESSAAVSSERDLKALSIPLLLRDQVIGEIEFERDADFSEDEQMLIESVTSQAVLALENARLVEESQQLALQERLVSDISSKIWASTTIDSVLQTAVRELGRALNATDATIELRMAETYDN